MGNNAPCARLVAEKLRTGKKLTRDELALHVLAQKVAEAQRQADKKPN